MSLTGGGGEAAIATATAYQKQRTSTKFVFILWSQHRIKINQNIKYKKIAMRAGPSIRNLQVTAQLVELKSSLPVNLRWRWKPQVPPEHS
jgi:hypothetical protein